MVQILIWSLCFAIVFGLARYAPPLNLNAEAIAVAIPTSLALAIISVAIMRAVLSFGKMRHARTRCLLIIAITAVAYPKVMGLYPGDPTVHAMLSWLIASTAFWIVFTCKMAREHGLALVRLSNQPSWEQSGIVSQLADPGVFGRSLAQRPTGQLV